MGGKNEVRHAIKPCPHKWRLVGSKISCVFETLLISYPIDRDVLSWSRAAIHIDELDPYLTLKV